jgi:mannose-6-phosphate isomerase
MWYALCAFMIRLHNSLQHYAWGSLSDIAEFLGTVASGKPEAELWLGAHEKAPSCIVRGGERASLRDVLRDEPTWLGADAGTELPFLAKLLAAATPLSLQAHPNEAQARVGYEREERAGVPLGAAERSYKDPHAKPEIIMALVRPFYALSGFREPIASHALLGELGVPSDAAVMKALLGGDLRQALSALLLSPEAASECLAPMQRALLRPDTEHDEQLRWLARIANLYPNDAGVVVAALLNLVVLLPGDALRMGPCQVHAYLEGFGLEVMGSSDNVLRAGLTPKHIDARELLSIVDTRALQPDVIRANDAAIRVVSIPGAPFVLEVRMLTELSCVCEGPEIVLVLAGAVRSLDGSAPRGTSWFAPRGERLQLAAEAAGTVIARVRMRDVHDP